MATETNTNTTTSNFFSSGLRQKVDQLMDILYAGGVNNPMDSIEQCSGARFDVTMTGQELTAWMVADFEHNLATSPEVDRALMEWNRARRAKIVLPSGWPV